MPRGAIKTAGPGQGSDAEKASTARTARRKHEEAQPETPEIVNAFAALSASVMKVYDLTQDSGDARLMYPAIAIRNATENLRLALAYPRAGDHPDAIAELGDAL